MGSILSLGAALVLLVAEEIVNRPCLGMLHRIHSFAHRNAAHRTSSLLHCCLLTIVLVAPLASKLPSVRAKCWYLNFYPIEKEHLLSAWLCFHVRGKTTSEQTVGGCTRGLLVSVSCELIAMHGVVGFFISI